MNREIELTDVLDFQEKYHQNEQNKIIEKNIQKFGIMNANQEDSQENFSFEFNISVPDVKIYNQQGSQQCDAYAFLRVVKDVLRKNTNLDIDCLDLSSTYIHFFDKLEKTNILYNELIDCKKLTLEIIRQKVNQIIGSYETFHFCREILNKYGMVPSSIMNDVNENYQESLSMELLRDKIKADAVVLIHLSKKERKIMKKELMYEAFQFLSKIYGNPSTEFSFDGTIFTPL